MGSTIKAIDKSDLTFEANGKKYVIETGLSMSRFVLYQQLEVEVGYGYSMSALYELHKALYDDLNKLKLVDASHKVYNLLTATRDLTRQENPVFRLCALFINREDEDRGEISGEQIQAKIDDWKAENIEVGFFLGFAQGIIGGFMNNSTKDIPSPEAKKKENESEE
jgi:hypothetical protein